MDHCAPRQKGEYLAVSEPERLALHKAARAALGDQEGDTLMALSPPANTDMATLQALERTEERLGARITAVEERLGARITAVEGRITSTEERLGARIDTVEERLGARIDAVEGRITSTEERLGARITAAVAELRAELMTAIHRSERRVMAVIVVAFLGTNVLG